MKRRLNNLANAYYARRAQQAIRQPSAFTGEELLQILRELPLQDGAIWLADLSDDQIKALSDAMPLTAHTLWLRSLTDEELEEEANRYSL